MINLLIGALATAAFILLLKYSHTNNLKINWWQWCLIIGCMIYSIFVIEVIIGFIDEGALRASLVMGLIFGLIAVIWSVLLSRFIFKKQ